MTLHVHWRQCCTYGMTHDECPCVVVTKPVDRIECPTPEEHGRPLDRPKSPSLPDTTRN